MHFGSGNGNETDDSQFSSAVNIYSTNALSINENLLYHEEYENSSEKY